MKIHQHKFLFIGVLFCIGLILILHQLESPNSATVERPKWKGIDTYIPVGHRLVPIELSNAKSVDPLIDAFAYVDLLHPKSKAQIAHGLKLIRSPLKKDIFAILVEDRFVKGILKHGDEFFIVVRGKEEKDGNTKIIKSKRKIIWEES